MHFGEKYSLICHRYPTPRRRRGEQTSVCRRDHCSSTCVAGIVRSMSHKLGVLPSPLWGGDGGGGRSLLTRLVKQQRPPSPTLPHQGGGSAPGLPRGWQPLAWRLTPRGGPHQLLSLAPLLIDLAHSLERP